MAIVLEEVFKVYQELTKKSEEDSIYGVILFIEKLIY